MSRTSANVRLLPHEMADFRHFFIGWTDRTLTGHRKMSGFAKRRPRQDRQDICLRGNVHVRLTMPSYFDGHRRAIQISAAGIYSHHHLRLKARRCSLRCSGVVVAKAETTLRATKAPTTISMCMSRVPPDRHGSVTTAGHNGSRVLPPPSPSRGRGAAKSQPLQNFI